MTVWTPKPVEIPGTELEYVGPYGLVTVRQMPLITVGAGWYEDLRVVARNGRRRGRRSPRYRRGGVLMNDLCAAGSVPCAWYDSLRLDRDRWRREANRFRSLARDAEGRTTALGLRVIALKNAGMETAAKLGEAEQRIKEIATLLEGAVHGHRLDEPFAFSRGESADIEAALELARAKVA